MVKQHGLKDSDLPDETTFRGEEAAAIRLLIESRVGYISVINCSRLYDSLLARVSPPLSSCADTRQKIMDSASFLMRINTVPAVEDIGYDAFQDAASEVITTGQLAYAQRPPTCEMVDEGDDAYSCARCFFNQKLDISYE